MKRKGYKNINCDDLLLIIPNATIRVHISETSGGIQMPSPPNRKASSAAIIPISNTPRKSDKTADHNGRSIENQNRYA